MGLTNIAIEPHFDINDKERIENVLSKDSFTKSFIAISDDGFITIKDDKINIEDIRQEFDKAILFLFNKLQRGEKNVEQ